MEFPVITNVFQYEPEESFIKQNSGKTCITFLKQPIWGQKKSLFRA